MPVPPDSGPGPISSQNVLEAIAAVLVTLSAWLMRKSGKTPRPSGIVTHADLERVSLALEGLQSATEALERKVDRHGAVMEDHGRRLNRIEVRAEGASA